MGRSSKQQAAENRNLIVEKTSELFKARQIADVSIPDIMKAAGMTAGGFYKHFESKEALVLEAAELAFIKARERWDSIDENDKGSVQHNIADYYFSPKPAQKRCPMLAFGGDVMKSNASEQLAKDCTDGIKSLMECFIGHPHDEQGADDEKNLVLFAAMVGANYLGEISSDPAFAERLKKAVLAAIK
ncbi:Potential acrAB operon repressor [Cedecea davisae]|uniref:Transcriptional regulator, TetR family n=1 Tax=Cedecea davisae DSM 4568 TaxID=566551 RepID=S3IZ54_9ENTR|nr:TetR/AcrR family transcriptional regulator [Cedecea davisae]EPF17781.1 transcriptional regulator, TetR family [Cedecea davisae DSM 4568]SUX28000.1 Potential acrAB operon repressor [Cedecea davisae]